MKGRIFLKECAGTDLPALCGLWATGPPTGFGFRASHSPARCLLLRPGPGPANRI